MNKFEGINNLSPSMQTAAKTVYTTFEILKEEGGELSGKDIIERIPIRIELNDWENTRYEKSGYIRWQSILHFYTVDCSKAGYLRKQKGIWYLTIEGEKAMELGAVGLLKSASEKYRAWDLERKKDIEPDIEEIIEKGDETEKILKANLEQLEEKAIEGIKQHISNYNPYEFQDLIAALLRAMGYYTPFVSPKGRDGGLDIIAYRDPLGATTPRIKVQVKHRPQASISVDDIRSLIGLLNKDGDIGLFVTSGRFTSESERFARDSHTHVKLIDIDSFIQLWIDFYQKLSDEEKNLLPLYPIYYLGTNE
jgi:restriction system protein